MQAQVNVWGNDIVINVEQHSKTVWVASGVCNDQIVTVKRQTKGAAISGWVDAARYKSG